MEKTGFEQLLRGLQRPDHWAIYDVVGEWFEATMFQAASDSDDEPRGFYLMLDKIVRHDEFRADELREVIAGLWMGEASEPEIVEQIEEYYWRAKSVREYLEARGEAKPRDEASDEAERVFRERQAKAEAGAFKLN